MSMSSYLEHVEQLSKDDLHSETSRLVRVTRKNTAELIAHLAEISRRKAYLPDHTSMWMYCVEGLGLSEGEAATRRQVANVCIDYPELLNSLAENRISLTVAAKLAPHLREENSSNLIARCEGMTKVQVEEHLIRFKPKPAVSPGIRRARGPAARKSGSTEKLLFAQDGKDAQEASRAAARVEPVQPEVFNFRFATSGEFKRKLERLAEVLGVVDVPGNLATLLEGAIDLALEKKDPKKKLERRRVRDAKKSALAARSGHRPDDARSTERASRYIPSAIRERVFEQAGYRCEFVGSDGVRCEERTGVQVDHVAPRGLGGSDEISNLRCMCGAHNRWLAVQVYGEERVRSAIARRAPGGG